MHSVILDHYTQCPFDNSFHRKNSLRAYRASNPNIKSGVDTPPNEPPQPTMSSLPRQSVLTWSPGQVLMTSPLINWTPYFATMATNPTAKYSLDFQLSCSKSDSYFEDTTTPSPKDSENNTIVPRNSEPSTMSTPVLQDVGPSTLPDRSSGVKALDSESLSDPLSLAESKPSSTSSAIAGTQPRQAHRVPPTTSKPTSPEAPRPSSSPDQATYHRAKSITATANRSISPGSSFNRPRHQLSSRSVDGPTRTSRPSSSRRSSTFPIYRTASRTGSFILSRNEPRPIDFAGVVQRTREQKESEVKDSILFQALEEPENESQCQTPEPRNIHDHPIDWTSPDSRAAQ